MTRFDQGWPEPSPVPDDPAPALAPEQPAPEWPGQQQPAVGQPAETRSRWVWLAAAGVGVLVVAGIGAALVLQAPDPAPERAPVAPGAAAVEPGGTAVGPGAAAAPAAREGLAPGTTTVVYEVAGSGTGSIEYTDPDGDIIRRGGVPLPWRTTFTVRGERPPLVLIAQRKKGGGGEVTCTITYGDKVVTTATQTGRYAAPQCSA